MKILNIIAVCFLFLSITACGQKGNGDVIKETRDLDSSFDKITTQQGIQVYLTQDASVDLEVETDSNLMDILKTEVDNGVLKIYFDKNISFAKERNVYLSTPDITSLKASSGSAFLSENTINAEDLSLKTSSGANIRVAVKTENLSCDTSSGSNIKVTGETKNLETDASSGSVIQCKELKAENCKSDVSSGANTSVYVSNSFDGNASSGGFIRCKGDPESREKHTSSGGSIKF